MILLKLRLYIFFLENLSCVNIKTMFILFLSFHSLTSCYACFVYLSFIIIKNTCVFLSSLYLLILLLH